MAQVKTLIMYKCHKTETKHYAMHYGATIVEDSLQKIMETQETKPPEARNLVLYGLSAVGILTCIIGKIVLNSELCEPIDARYALRT